MAELKDSFLNSFCNLTNEKKIEFSYFLNESYTIKKEIDDIGILENKIQERNLLNTVHRINNLGIYPVAHQQAVNALSSIIRLLKNQRLIESFEYSYSDDFGDEMEIGFKMPGYEDCELSVYYNDADDSDIWTILSFSKNGEDFIKSGPILNVLQIFNEIFI